MRIWSPVAVASLIGVILTPARAGEPSVRELVALAPILDSSAKGCRSIDVGGSMGGVKGRGPRMRFRAVYRAPHHFSLLISDATDGTPLVICSGREILIYDPVGPTVYYSEGGLNRQHRILVDFPSILSSLSNDNMGSRLGTE